MTRTPKALILSLALALAVTGCGAAPAGDVAAEAVALESVALEAVGYTTADTGEEAAGTGAETAARPRLVRKLLRKNTLHGEVVVRGRDGVDRTVVVQRGEVTAADASGFTVKSSDGFELTWAYGEKSRVVQDREKAERSAVKIGVKVGAGGVREGTAVTARLVVVG
ncbi:hypothetical protein QLQ12_23535 [Actinoplanes sp. NEAU-A12]|uniref:DUF5666 domain-containing protein n=1 Tax=Actinoplanes sandaracinus TaxID=3045177 RepID=A0ABT6WPA5_9ACTN|nr:hypothetical protein [Actinoplanes sandaracinus]MDI6101597.1 hypothetical protein [Actinoplanes sandaracinus]